MFKNSLKAIVQIVSIVALCLTSISQLKAAEVWTEKPKSAPYLVNLPDFKELLKIALPSVVNIAIEQKVKNKMRGMPFEFFGPFMGMDPRLPQREFKNKGIGSGFVISEDGYILTNQHVVENADSIIVTFPSDVSLEEFKAKVVGVDERTDVALVKIDTKQKLKPLPLGDSGSLLVGEWALAIGNPFGLSHSVSLGIVSAKERRDVHPGGRNGIFDFIQTDASINPGNSGGPLINLKGEVIGINAAMNAAGQGIGFAIPINLVKSILVDLKQKGKVKRSWLGIMVQKMDQNLAKSYGLSHAQGAIVAQVVEGGPAEKAGLIAGDVVLEFNNQPVKDYTDLTLMASRAGIHQPASVLVLRDGKKITLKVVLGELPNNEDVDLNDSSKIEQGNSLGLHLMDLTPQIKERLGIKEKQGVVVSDIDEEGAAFEAGIRSGDIISKLNDKNVISSQELGKQIKLIKTGDMLRFLIKRENNALFVAFQKP